MKKPDNFLGMTDDDTITWREMLASTSEIVGDRVVAKWLCEHAAGVESSEWIDILDDKVSQRCGLHLDAMMRRYLAGEPLQYVMGRWAFRHLDLLVDERVLIPRPETEQLVDLVRSFINASSLDHHVVVDLGTGTGAIGLSLLQEEPIDSLSVWLTDASQDAVDVAIANLAGVGRQAMNAHVAVGSWYEALPDELRGNVDVIVSNPPYIAHGDPEVEEIVRTWEPSEALFSDDEGLADIRAIVFGASTWLRAGGLLALEMGYMQADDVSRLCHDAGLQNVLIHDDAAGKSRFIIAVAASAE